ncbi:2-oxoacid:acceptor oxidoreductase family protein [Desulfobaculum bizertense]|uniref:2-oxoglutarate ferredoxin oxidoreductase subunit gamma n=1 Tax=Desulfobaculum bizertense DSM 18034 TaxID=1121442 RepID=A0A1T4VXV4_9BACT|nr:2-oxoacid:acceptor oxidoreductase family protein [Desulfobaculum bizertense]UIJ36944.1 2-oxoacid:acceptor oxidoreductase family protein [Desulfobaculum bizertense]SKA69739.1 2-oxoglutarate ferredoxin oxidoreductase subunit gamma [Desulfobaculum bizertense DSM 18034]
MSSHATLQRFEICLSGLGGQGVLTLGKIMGQALALGHGFNVTQTQSYGPEARGGASRSDLVISTESISYPKTDKIDLLVALSQEACNKYYSLLKPNGVLLVNDTLVKQVPTNQYLGLPFSELAQDKLGLIQAMNTIVLGACSFLLPFAQPKLMKNSLEQTLPAKILDINIKAFSMGHDAAKEKYKAPPSEWADLYPPAKSKK